MSKKPSVYWVVKTDDMYWLREGGVTPLQAKAERYESRAKALADINKYCDNFWLATTRPVRVRSRR
jgi:hypothetical protein